MHAHVDMVHTERPFAISFLEGTQVGPSLGMMSLSVKPRMGRTPQRYLEYDAPFRDAPHVDC